MTDIPFTRGPHRIAPGIYAYLQPRGSWGQSNAGLIVDGERSLLIDTLFDRQHTAAMLAALREVEPATANLDWVINTHANGDHCWGNDLVRGARILTSRACAEEMRELPPHRLALLMRVARVLAALGPVGRGLGTLCDALGLARAGALLAASSYVVRAFGEFDFRGIELVLPTDTFSGDRELSIGSRRVELWEVGPAHTRGDVVVFVPDARVLFAGDLLFANAHPLLWEGPVSRWRAACERILDADVEVIVPGHGRLCDRAAVVSLRDYLDWLWTAAQRRFDAGLGVMAAARELATELEVGPFAGWAEPERVVVNVAACYRERTGTPHGDDTIAQFGAMARLRREITAAGRITFGSRRTQDL
ncbi:MAG: MBL fold metallo-hydrolase [Polyangiaceae bacterium]|nr:MBL fold metallo-hydrolase [Polyangiaceae bacterium]